MTAKISDTPQSSRRSWLPKRKIVWVLLLYVVVILWLQLADPMGDRGSANAFSMITGVLALITVALWLLFFSGGSWLRRLAKLAVFSLPIVLFLSFFKLEKFSGEMVPSFVRHSAPASDRTLEVPPSAILNEAPEDATLAATAPSEQPAQKVDMAPLPDASEDANAAVAVAATATATADDGTATEAGATTGTEAASSPLLAGNPDDFPGFLGRGRSAAVDHVELARDWQATPPQQVWRQPIGAGLSGFAVVGGMAFTMEQRGDSELVTCYDALSGELRWSHGSEVRYESLVAGIGPRTTPSVDQGRVYAVGAYGDLVALDAASGRLLWRKDLEQEVGLTQDEEMKILPYGRSNSPLVFEDLLIVAGGGDPQRKVDSLIAYNKVTGEEVWRGGDSQVSCASPTVATLAGRQQILSVEAGFVNAYDPRDGSRLWQYPWPSRTEGDAAVSQPVPLAPDDLFVSKGYGIGSARLRLTTQTDGTLTPVEQWTNARVLRTKFTNVTIYQGHAYGLSDGILECADLSTGERKWKGGRYRQGQLLRVGGVLLVLAESGEMFMIEATPERANEVLGQFQAVEGRTWNTFALYGDLLLVRNGEEAAAYRLPLN